MSVLGEAINYQNDRPTTEEALQKLQCDRIDKEAISERNLYHCAELP